jgi:hypothetical protein
VRVFKKDEIPAENPPQETWDKVAYVLEGTTNPDGWAVWNADSDVQCLPEAEYVVMVHRLDKYEEGTIPTGTSAGWASGCEGSISREIVFGEEAPQAIPGDLDGDGDIDMADNTILRSTLGKCNGDVGFIAEADYDQDGCVTYTDYRTWYIYYRTQ